MGDAHNGKLGYFKVQSIMLIKIRGTLMKNKLWIAASLLLVSSASQAAITTYTDEATFLGAVGSSTTYDFETSSGFPADINGAGSGGFIAAGTFGGITNDATVYQSLLAQSGVQVMTGNVGTFGGATLNFLPGTTGIGLWGLDLTADEILRVTVEFMTAGTQQFDITLGGDPRITPQYFGVWDATDSILSAALVGGNLDGSGLFTRAWAIDDLSVASSSIPPVPVPAAVWLFGTALIGFVGMSRRRKVA